jgi:predicted nucleic acid-binding protein
MARPVVLSDAGPLVALSLIDRLDLLHSLLGRITITDVVQAEVMAGGNRPGQAAIAAAIRAKRIRVIIDEWPEPKLRDLDEGEASTLRAAIHCGVPCLQAKTRRLVPSVRTLFEQLLAHDFRISAELIRTALAQAGED